MDDDRRIQKDVLDELEWEPSIDAAGIGVAVHDGVVTLTGEVAYYAYKHRAEDAAGRVYGVKGVANELEVPLSVSVEETDEDLVQKALRALRANLSVPVEKLQVRMSHGVVTLKGEVAWEYQRRAAARAVRDLVGVRGVVNEIRVQPLVRPTDVKKKITAALHRRAQLDAEHVTVEARGGTVTLKGTVSSLWEKREAERSAWAAPGVSNVRNEITVEAKLPLAF